jgi:hypothetical protein
MKNLRGNRVKHKTNLLLGQLSFNSFESNTNRSHRELLATARNGEFVELADNAFAHFPNSSSTEEEFHASATNSSRLRFQIN